MTSFSVLLQEYMAKPKYHNVRDEMGKFRSAEFRKTVKKAEAVMNASTPDRGYSADDLFRKLAAAVEIVAKGFRPSLVITGTAGAGKSHLVMDALKKAGLTRGSGYVLVKGKTTPAALYHTLFMNRNRLLVFDDTDSVWDNPDSVSILKAALDSYSQRTVSWVTTRTVNVSKLSRKEQKKMIRQTDATLDKDPAASVRLPSEFDFEGRIIFISNLSREKLDDAVLSRSMVVDVTLSPEEMFERIRSVIDKVGNQKLSVQEKLHILQTLIHLRQQGKLKREVSMRTFVAACDLAASGYKAWQTVIDLV